MMIDKKQYEVIDTPLLGKLREVEEQSRYFFALHHLQEECTLGSVYSRSDPHY